MTNPDLNTFSDWHRQELRRMLPDSDSALVGRWIEHAEIQCQIVRHIRAAPMPSEHRKLFQTQLAHIDKGIEGLLMLWGQGNRIQHQRTLADTHEPQSNDIIGRNNDIISNAFNLWRELVKLKQDIESMLPETGNPGRPRADKYGLVSELAHAYELAGFGSPSGDTFTDVIRICLDAAGLPSDDPARSLKTLK